MVFGPQVRQDALDGGAGDNWEARVALAGDWLVDGADGRAAAYVERRASEDCHEFRVHFISPFMEVQLLLLFESGCLTTSGFTMEQIPTPNPFGPKSDCRCR